MALDKNFECQNTIVGLFEKGSFPVISLQLACAILLTGTFNILLGQLNQTRYISSVLAGVAVGPSLLGGTETFKWMITKSGGTSLVELVSSIGLMFFSFLVGVKTDMDMVLKARKKTFVIGFCTFTIPLIFNAAVCFFIMNHISMDQDLYDSLKFITLILSCSSFYDTACVVGDLNLLNSEIGRLALAISIITGLCSWLFTFALETLHEATTLKAVMVIFSWMSKGFIVMFVLLIIRPMISWMNKNTPEGKTLKEEYVGLILLAVLGTALYSEAIGQHAMFGPLMIGLLVPVGTPVGIAVQKKFDCFVSYVLLPAFFVVVGYPVHAFQVRMKDFAIVELILFLALFARLTAVVLASFYCQMRIQDSFSLGLILNCGGIYHLMYLTSLYAEKVLNQETYTIMLFTIASITMITTPIVKKLYDPSRKYSGYKRQGIQYSTIKGELRILACVYEQDSVPTILNFLEATNPTKDGTVCIYVLHLIELVGRAASLLVEHKRYKKKTYTHSRSRNTSEKIISAFNHFEQLNQCFIIGECFTAVSPFASMHTDVAQIAIDKRANMIIIPFLELAQHPIRAANRSILGKAPCSVGILFDHINGSKPVMDVLARCHNVAMIFIGGPDDQEALAYSMKIADTPDLYLTVFRFTHSNSKYGSKKRKKDDEVLINELFGMIMTSGNIMYKEEEITDCADTAFKIKSMEDTYDFIIVGRRHDNNSPILSGLDEWCVYKELGVIGDLLATSNSHGEFSILVMQQ
ncbi:hypothetical protein C5167_030453 [Papaver somniferum]|uniref:cation/H(+) antiporter 15-like n=1 Tax=Papaver somniferum TaxID=3469 RepID=UPI000E702912|nr:cation/H(+) antiporter 15-like [Papaver somniferum]RZC86375.1 hypothetical protein C5167_030453 [Papaver somniferum]